MTSDTQISLSAIIDLNPPERRGDSSLFVKSIYRPISFIVTWFLLKFKITANQVTYTSGLVALIGAIFLSIDSFPYKILGALLFNVWVVLDCVDGNIARVRGTASKYGDFVDTTFGYIAYGLIFIASGIAAQNGTAFISGAVGDINYILLGALAAISNLIMRLMYQHFLRVTGQSLYGVRKSQRKWARELGLTGVLPLAILIFILADLLHWVIIFYASFHILAFCFVAYRMIRTLTGLQASERAE